MILPCIVTRLQLTALNALNADIAIRCPDGQVIPGGDAAALRGAAAYLFQPLGKQRKVCKQWEVIGKPQ